MKTAPTSRALGAAVALTLAAGTWAAPPPSTTPPFGLRDKTPNHLALTHATIVAAPGQTIENGTLVIRDGRVEALGAGLPVPAGATELDLAGKRIYPGFVEPYSEYGLAGVEALNPKKKDDRPKYRGTRTGTNAWNDAIHAERDWVEAFTPDEETAKALRQRGVTAVMSAKQDGVFRGRGFVASLGSGLANDEILVAQGPHFAAFDKGSSQQAYPSSLMGSIALVRQTLLDARWYGQAQAAFAKNRAQTPPETNAALAALAAYHGPLVFETEEDLSLLRAARIGQEMSLPLVHVGSGFEYARADEIAALGAPLILPVSFPEAPAVERPEDEADVSLADLRHWERAPGNAAVIAAKGVRFAFTAHRLRKDEDFLKNVRRTIRRGLPAETALAALTLVPAELAGIADRAGSLAPGKRADFFVADGDLLVSDDASLLAVFVAGRKVEEMRPLDAFDFRGTYRLGRGGKAEDLAVYGKTGDLCGTLGAGKKAAELEDVSAEPSVLRFTAGETRFTAQRIGERFDGWAAGPGGRERVTLARTGPPPAGKSCGWGDEKKGDPDAAPLVSKLTYPNVAFGFETRPQPEDVLVRNATLWTSESEGVLEGADLLVLGGKIAAIGRGLTAPAGVRVIDATGRHVSAGMIDEHSHVAISKGVNEGSHAVTAEVRIGDVIDPEDIGIYRALAGGTTAAQLLHGSANPIGGQAQIVKMRWGSSPEQMKLAGSTPSIKFALGENVKQSNWGDRERERYPQTRMGVETLMKDAFLAARDDQEAWQRYRALSAAEQERTVPPRRDLTLEALVEILGGERIVHCHSYVQSEMLMLMRLAEELGFRIGTFTHVLEGYKVAPEMAKHGAGASSFSDWWAYKFEVYDAIPYNTCLLHERGVVTSINSDSEDLIRRLNTEAAKSVMYCGMEPEEALKLASLNPAIQLKAGDRMGSLKVGKDADFVIWSGSPLSMFSRAEETWVDGTQLFSRVRDAELRQAVAAERRALVAKILAGGGKRDGWGEHGAKKRDKDWDCEDVEDVWHVQS